jgi:hypothetical protein
MKIEVSDARRADVVFKRADWTEARGDSLSIATMASVSIKRADRTEARA